MLEPHPQRLAASLYRREYLGEGIVTGISVATLLEMGLSLVCQWPRCGPRFKPGTFGMRSGVLDAAVGVLL